MTSDVAGCLQPRAGRRASCRLREWAKRQATGETVGHARRYNPRGGRTAAPDGRPAGRAGVELLGKAAERCCQSGSNAERTAQMGTLRSAGPVSRRSSFDTHRYVPPPNPSQVARFSGIVSRCPGLSQVLAGWHSGVDQVSWTMRLSWGQEGAVGRGGTRDVGVHPPRPVTE